MGFLAPERTLAEEPPSLWASYLWGPAAPWWLVPVMALLGVARFCLTLLGMGPLFLWTWRPAARLSGIWGTKLLGIECRP